MTSLRNRPVVGRLGMSLMLGIVLFQGGLVRRTEAQALQSMVIVTGDHGRGSAFVVSMDGRTYLVTNSHVIQGNTNVKFKTLDNQELLTGPLQIADKADLVRAEVASTTPALKVATQLDQKLKFGEAIVVSGNSEGEGVVREIPGKIVGIGPDRIEVDAPFVPGNSGSPILMKNTGSVIGVATYMTIPPALKKGEKSPTSLNVVRRFGYRLDTVGTWISPDNPDRLEQEGLKLERMDETMHLVIAILDSSISDLLRGSGAYVKKEQAASNPGIAALAVAIDDFAGRLRSTKLSTKARLTESGRQYLTKLFEALRAATVNDVRGFKEENFSGYFAMKFNEHLDRRKDLYEFLDDLLSDGPKYGTSKASQTADATRPHVDYSKLSFQLTQDGSSASSAEKRLRASYPASAKPETFAGLYWALQKPDRNTVVYQMRGNSFDLPAASDGLYKLSVEYRPGSLSRTISNVLTIAIGTVGMPAKPAAPTAATGVAATAGNGFINTLGMKFVPVPGTQILMCIHETRKGDYAEYAMANPKVDQAWKNPVIEGIPASTDDSHPVVSVSWGEAVAFCEWLSEKEGRKYRLPTDREWSCAVGLSTESKDGTPESLSGKVRDEYPWGKAWPPPKGAGNYPDESMKEKLSRLAAIQGYSDGFATTAPVMSFEPNKLGIYDLGGNVVEYCQEQFGASQKLHLVRGGSWYEESATSEACLSSTRQKASTKNGFRGFRCVVTAQNDSATAPKLDEGPIMESEDLVVSGKKFTEGTLRNKEVAYGNRGWVWWKVPESLWGSRYTKVDGGDPPVIKVRAKRDTVVQVFNVPGDAGVDLSGWEQTELKFTYNTTSWPEVVVYTKRLFSGQELEIPQRNWGGTSVILPPATKANASTKPASSSGVAATAGNGFTNTLGMKFVPVPGTQIWMCIHETRTKDYAAYAADTPGVDSCWKTVNHDGVPVSDGDDYPVVCVHHDDANGFCAWLTKKEGRTYRLPTDHEWSMAVDIGTREAVSSSPMQLSQKIADEYPWGREFPPPKGAGNLADSNFKERVPSVNAIEGYTDGYVTTAPVMMFTPNKLGIYDLSGNVWEWCDDLNTVNSTNYWVVRGGSWLSSDRGALLSSNRARFKARDDARNDERGFRCVIEGKP